MKRIPKESSESSICDICKNIIGCVRQGNNMKALRFKVDKREEHGGKERVKRAPEAFPNMKRREGKRRNRAGKYGTNAKRRAYSKKIKPEEAFFKVCRA